MERGERPRWPSLLRRRVWTRAEPQLQRARVLSTALSSALSTALSSTWVTSLLAARHRLPEMVRRWTAPRGAAEQAVLRPDTSAMFASLVRRGQLLVERQLRLLDEMEAAEQDPDRLAQLFAVDHLATRLRRNAENLLVLTAQESHRRRREPAPLSRVLLGAVAEAEQYPRIRLAGPDDALVPAHVVPDLLRLLAELLDNATAFSSPSTAVTVHTELVEDTAVVRIRDTGMGMTDERIAEANTRLASPAPVETSAVDHVGLFVVSHLAARHGMEVELDAAPDGGVQAVLRIPATALVPRGVAGSPPPAPAAPARSLARPWTGRTTGWWLAAPDPSTAWLTEAAEPAEPRTGGTTAAGLPLRVRSDTGTGQTGAGAQESVARPARTGPLPVAAHDPAGDPAHDQVHDRADDPAVDRPEDPDPGPAPEPGLAAAPADMPVELPAEMPTPADVGTMLARFHSGVRRADDEELAERPSSS